MHRHKKIRAHSDGSEVLFTVSRTLRKRKKVPSVSISSAEKPSVRTHIKYNSIHASSDIFSSSLSQSSRCLLIIWINMYFPPPSAGIPTAELLCRWNNGPRAQTTLQLMTEELARALTQKEPHNAHQQPTQRVLSVISTFEV